MSDTARAYGGVLATRRHRCYKHRCLSQVVEESMSDVNQALGHEHADHPRGSPATPRERGAHLHRPHRAGEDDDRRRRQRSEPSSRQTVYRYFADRDDLLLAGVLAELEATRVGPDPSEAMALAARSPTDAVASLVEGLVHTLATIAANPVLSTLLSAERDSVRSTIDGASGALFSMYADELRPWLELGQNASLLRDDVTPDEIAELALRLTLSMMTTPGPVERDESQLRTYLKTFLTPALAGPRSVDERRT